MSLQQSRDAEIGEWREAMLKWKAECESGLALRDHFAAAALTGLLCNGDYSIEAIPCHAFTVADAMLRERERTNHDAAPAARASCDDGRPQAAGESGNLGSPSTAGCTGDTPVTEPLPKEKRAEVSDGSEPVAWAVLAKDIGATAAICTTFMEAERLATRSRDWQKAIVPLYRNPQPTFTAEEREAVRFCSEFASMGERADLAATLRGLLERMK